MLFGGRKEIINVIIEVSRSIIVTISFIFLLLGILNVRFKLGCLRINIM